MKKDTILRCGLIALCVLFHFARGRVCADEPKMLIPPTEEAKPAEPQTPPRSSYDSLTEPRGTFKAMKDKRDKAIREQLPQEKKDAATPAPPPESTQGPIINFNNVAITEVLKYVSRLTGKNFAYDPQELQFNVTVISDHPNSVEEVMAMVIQSLRIHGYLVMEEGDSYLIHTNPTVRSANALDENKGISGPQLATQVFVLQNLAADSCAAVVKAMVSDSALVEPVGDSHLVVSDTTENLKRVGDVIRQIDSQKGALEIAQYVAINESPATIATLADRLLSPIVGDKPLVLVPHVASNSIFIVSTPQMIDRALAVMQTIDLNLAKTGMFSPDQKFDAEAAARALREKQKEMGRETAHIEGLTDEQIRKALLEHGIDQTLVDNLSGKAARDLLQKTLRKSYAESELPFGTVEATQFYIYRLQYRKSTEVANALRAIAASLTGGPQAGAVGGAPVNLELAQSDIIITLTSLQPVEDNNTIVFTGTRATLQKVRELLAEIDIPVRQVFIEALVLDTTLANSLQFGVEWEGKIQKNNFGAGVGFRDPNVSSGGFGPGTMDQIQQTTPPQLVPSVAPGFSASAIGRKIKFHGKGFRSTGTLVTALHNDTETHIIMNPKIMTEHNVPAEVFVGQQTPIKGQSIANATSGTTSSIVATNYNIQNTGVDLKVTPLISSGQTVTLIIEQRVSSANTTQVANQGNQNAPPATINETRTTTRVHIPSDHFLVISGMIQEANNLTDNYIPCLGGLPFIGSLFGVKLQQYVTRNVMIFIRPIIIDVDIDIDRITQREEKLFKEKATVQQGFSKEMDDLKSLLNLQGWGNY